MNKKRKSEDRSQKSERRGLCLICLILSLAAASYAATDIVGSAIAALNRSDFEGAAALVQNYRRANGATPEMLEAESWIARAEFARGHLDQAEKFAQETHRLALAALKKRSLGRDPNAALPLALGASIEVEADIMAQRGNRADAVAFLQSQYRTYRATSIGNRIRKNINMLSMEGKPAPALRGTILPKGKPALLFFWAHWCPDCKAEVPTLRQLMAEFGPKGLVLIAPTQHYGYAAGGEDAAPAAETRYIEQIRKTYYSGVI
ncbi:MAG TPA: TlpA disulfide reductase family protein, partial [Bryobacteraceae bacterium]|nr:TlpA disulfide reductase family protein [Bryobacteraceae bacterium]